MKEESNLSYQSEDVKEFFVKETKLYKEANFNKSTKHQMIMEDITSDQRLFHFAVLKKVRTLEDVKETFFEYAEHQKVYFLPKTLIADASGVLDMGTHQRSQGKNE